VNIPTRSKITIICNTTQGEKFHINVSRRTLVQKLKSRIQHKFDFDVRYLRLLDGGHNLDDTKSIRDYDMIDGDQIYAIQNLVGGKPVIYVLSTSVMDVSLLLNSVPEWSFSAIYPTRIPHTLSDGGQKIEWRVTTQENGALTDQASGVEVFYLYWEAQ
jgi:hypothetical protein